mgnify:CR=1 FL=1
MPQRRKRLEACSATLPCCSDGFCADGTLWEIRQRRKAGFCAQVGRPEGRGHGQGTAKL